MSTEQKDLIDTEELINNLDEELNEQQKEHGTSFHHEDHEVYEVYEGKD
jgi:hypothetical protein